MNKKIIIGIVVAIVLIVIVGGIVVFVQNKNKSKPEDIWQKYISCINDRNYEEMYNMITEESKQTISQEDFISRNKNIYEGIDMTDMKIEITGIEEQDKTTTKISYNSTMNTEAGEISFSNQVKLNKDKEKDYLITWNSTLIFPQLSNTDKVRIKTISAERGEILDKNGIVLAGNGTVSSVGIVPGKLGENKETNIEKIAELLGTTSDAINDELSASWVKDDTFVPLKKVATTETELKNQLLQIPGVKITSTSSRVYPLGEIAAHLTGYIRTITAEELEENRGKGYNSNSLIGKTGLEKQYEERLKGKDGVEIYIEDSQGNRKSEIAKIDVQDGEDIKLTIDANLQTEIYNKTKDNKGFFVVMEPKTGAILALVSTPSYDVNKFVLGMTDEEWNEINTDENKPMLARYLQKWCPGSTFKPVTGAIGLTTNSLSTEDTFSYNGLSWQKDESWGNYNVTTLTAYNGPKNLRNAIIYSDNIYFAQAVLKIGKDNFINTLNKLKFNETVDFPLSLAKSQYSNTDTIDSETLLADSGYGQGQILVNPIHMASIYSAFANDGNMIKPYLEYEENKQVEYLVENAFTKDAANIIKDDLIQVVETVGGTAHDMKVDGRTIAAKTGTAELKTSKEEEADILGWIDCFSTDSNNNQMVIISMIEDGRDAGGSRYLKGIIKTLY